MADREPPIPEDTSQGYFALVWAAARERAIAIGGEVVTMAFLLTGLMMIYLSTRVMRALGFPADRAKVLEDIDYYAVLAVVISFSLRFVLDSMLGVFARRQ